jgi:hypothetical protein
MRATALLSGPVRAESLLPEAVGGSSLGGVPQKLYQFDVCFV